MSDRHTAYMRRALALAELGRGLVEPNPLVGAVIVQGDQVIGEGYHRHFGGPHAEIEALNTAKASPAGATLYVTLEPCCHHGKTPPCTEAILCAGIARVVMAMVDPFPQVSGGGAKLLRDAGIDIVTDVEEEAALQLNAPYLKLLATGRPYVHAKWAMTLDGRIATVQRESKWITGEEARAHAHHFRGQMDAIIAGIGTVNADDPLLNARPPGPRTATRVILDSSLRIPTSSQLVQTAHSLPTLIATTEKAQPDRITELQQLGCEIMAFPAVDGRVPIDVLLAELGRRRYTNCLVEGGAEVLGGFVSARSIDAARVYVSSKVVGGTSALGPVGGTGIGKLTEALRLGPLQAISLGSDLFLSAVRALQ